MDSETLDGPGYAYKSSLMGAPFEFRLGADAIFWRKGPREGRIPYDRIRRVRLSFRPMTMQNYRFLTEIWATEGPKLQIASTSWKSIMEHERLDGAYTALVRELVRRIGAAGGKAVFETGSPAYLYWPGVIVFLAAGVAIAGLFVRALMEAAFLPAAVVAAFFAMFLWQASTFFRRNRPGTFAPDAVPSQVLPKT